MTEASGADAQRPASERCVVETIRHGEMEGLQLSETGRADVADFMAGVIDSETLVVRARTRCGLE